VPWSDEHVLGAAEVGPLAKELAVRVEDLDTVILAVADVDGAFGIDGHGVGRVELAGALASLAPIKQVLAVGSDFDDARVAVAVGDIDGVTFGREGDIGRAVEGFGVGTGLALDA